MADDQQSLSREGAEAGVLGALAVALWFLLLDALHGQPFLTPSLLGQVVLFGRDTPAMAAVPEAIAAYTGVHFLAFVILGVAVARIVDLATHEPVFRFLLFMLFVVFEVFFLGVTYIFFAQTAGVFPWWSILVANTLAAVAMTVYFRYRHPTLAQARGEPLGAETT